MKTIVMTGMIYSALTMCQALTVIECSPKQPQFLYPTPYPRSL